MTDNQPQAKDTAQESDKNSAKHPEESIQQNEPKEQNVTEQSEESSQQNDVKNPNRKLFVGGLLPDTTGKQLRDHFQKYGEIEDVKLRPGHGRCYAFIVFKDASGIKAAIDAGSHTINGEKVDASEAKIRQGKIFVGRLTPEISDEAIKSYFAKFGKIVGFEAPTERQTHQRRSFCFITYDSEAAAKEALKARRQTISGKEVAVNRVMGKRDDLLTFGQGGSLGRGQYGGYGSGQVGQGYGGFGPGGFAYGAYGGYNQAQGYGNYFSNYAYNGNQNVNQRGGNRGRGRGRQSHRQVPF